VYDVRVPPLCSIRQVLNAKGDVKISVNDFIIKASSLALKKVPEVNSSWANTAIRQYNHVSINVAISSDHGLFSPLIPNVDRLGLSDISNSVRTLADKAKVKKLDSKDLEV
jgi:pyruvate dehydrogenase E2 component (dihydrolipoamide acetyltransferase)